MEPPIRYTKTPDGVRLAYWTLGDGPALVFLFPWASHLQLEWQIPANRYLYEELATSHQLVRFDIRGTGLSQHGTPISLDLYAQDIANVLDAVSARTASVIAAGTSAPAAIAFSARHPDRINRLVLWEGPASVSDAGLQIETFYELVRRDYDVWVQALASVAAGFDEQETARAYAATLRGSMEQADMVAFAEVAWRFDASSMLGDVHCPTMAIHHRDAQLISADAMKRIAADIPDARLTILNGSTVYSSLPDGIAAIREFLGDTMVPERTRLGRSGVRTVLFTDLVGHTEMMRRLGDTRGREVLREHERITREAIAKHRGAEIKTDGDSFMMSFASVASAVECAVALQRTFAIRNETADEPLRVRIGLNAGEPVEDRGDLFGETVILAARIAAEAKSGEILIPEPVRHLLAGKGFVFADRGDFVPKGFDEAVRLYEVRWQE